jgi:hypothetical protein
MTPNAEKQEKTKNMLTSPCIDCPIHRQGIDKSGPTCMACEARLVYVAAIGSGRTDIVLPPTPKGSPPPASSFGRRPYKIGPYDRTNRKRRQPGPHAAVRTVMGARRVALGLSHGELADACLSTIRTIAHLESGSYNYTPRASTLNAIARVLKIPADTLLLPVKGAAKAPK